MNVKLLRRIKQHILKEPRRFDMGTFGERRSRKEYGEDAPQCGTVACIAGWAVILTTKIPQRATAPMPMIDRVAGMNALGISNEAAERLFYDGAWPTEFWDYVSNGSKKSAKIAAARIEHFIKTKGRE